MSDWKSPFIELPADGQEVYIRVISVYGQLAEAVYDASTQIFTVDIINAEIPLYMVSRWKAITPAPPSTLLLDVYPTNDFAWSVFQLSELQNKCMLVQRDSDDAFLTINYLNGYIDESTLVTFGGSDTVYVLEIYDARGTKQTFSQYNRTLQPIIISSGNLQILNGKICINFTTSFRRLLNYPYTYSQPNTTIAVTSMNSGYNATVAQVLVGRDAVATRQMIYSRPTNNFTLYSGSALESSTINNTSQKLLTSIFDNTNSKMRYNGTQIIIGTSGNETTNQGRQLGGLSDTFGYDGNVQLIIFFDSDMTTDIADIETYINNLFNIY